MSHIPILIALGVESWESYWQWGLPLKCAKQNKDSNCQNSSPFQEIYGPWSKQIQYEFSDLLVEGWWYNGEIYSWERQRPCKVNWTLRDDWGCSGEKWWSHSTQRIWSLYSNVEYTSSIPKYISKNTLHQRKAWATPHPNLSKQALLDQSISTSLKWCYPHTRKLCFCSIPAKTTCFSPLIPNLASYILERVALRPVKPTDMSL